MRRSQYRRASRNSGWFSGRRRIIAVAATLVAFGGIVTVTQVSNASTNNRTQKKALSACDSVQAPPASKLSTKTRRTTYTTNNGTVVQHPDDGAGDTVTTAQLRDRCRRWVMNNVGNNGKASTAPTTAATTAATTAPADDPSADPSAAPPGSGDTAKH